MPAKHKNTDIIRGSDGRFKPGTLSNPTGFKGESEVAELKKTLTERDLLLCVWNDAERLKTLKRLVAISQNGTDREALAASKLLLERAFGTPAQTIRVMPVRNDYELVYEPDDSPLLELPDPDEPDPDEISIPVWSPEAYLAAYEASHEPKNTTS